jgi:hypothetical protein
VGPTRRREDCIDPYVYYEFSVQKLVKQLGVASESWLATRRAAGERLPGEKRRPSSRRGKQERRGGHAGRRRKQGSLGASWLAARRATGERWPEEKGHAGEKWRPWWRFVVGRAAVGGQG